MYLWIIFLRLRRPITSYEIPKNERTTSACWIRINATYLHDSWNSRNKWLIGSDDSERISNFQHIRHIKHAISRYSQQLWVNLTQCFANVVSKDGQKSITNIQYENQKQTAKVKNIIRSFFSSSQIQIAEITDLWCLRFCVEKKKK